MASGFNFGAMYDTTTSSTAQPNFSFGNPATQTQAGLSFGLSTVASANTTPSLLGTSAVPSLFGTSTTPAVGAQAAPSVFGSTAPTSGAQNLSFGGLSTPVATPTATTALPTLNFAGAAPTLTVPSSGLSFSLPGAPATTTAANFSLPQQQQPQATTPAPLNFGLSTPNVAKSTPLNLTLGTAAATSTPVTSGSGFGLGGAQLPASVSTGFSFNLPSTPAAKLTPATTATLSFGLGQPGIFSSAATTTAAATVTTTVTSTAAAPVGLGGVVSTQVKTAANATQKELSPKDQPLPNEILQTVEAFKNVIKQQKQYSSDIARCSVREFRRVEQEINQLTNQINEMENQLVKNRQMAEKLKYDTAKTIQNVEMAQRTHDTPPGLQFENTAPLKFFLNLADQFEKDMQNLKMQIEIAERYVKDNKNPDVLTPHDLAMGLKRHNETFVALAGRLHSVHSQVESQKEIYMNIRKSLLQDNSNPFEKLTKKPEFEVSNVQNGFATNYIPKVATGPTPFNNLALGNSGINQNTTQQPPAYPGSAGTSGVTPLAAPITGIMTGGLQSSNTASLFGNTSFGQSNNNSFQLQKPPMTSKRSRV